jgi:hypothetical protein
MIEEIKQRHAATIQGDYDSFAPTPDEAQRHVVRVRYRLPDGRRATSFVAECYCGGVDNAANAEFFAHAHQDIATLLSRIEELESQRTASQQITAPRPLTASL